MTDTATAAIDFNAVTLPANAPKHLPKLGGKLKVALDFMVWGDPETLKPVPWPEAARKAGLTVRAMRYALERPDVRRYLTMQRQVFAATAAGGNISRAVQIRDQDDNRTAALQAVRWIEEVASGRTAQEGARVSAPGIVINIGAAAAPRATMVDTALIEINPLSESGPDADDTQR